MTPTENRIADPYHPLREAAQEVADEMIESFR